MEYLPLKNIQLATYAWKYHNYIVSIRRKEIPVARTHVDEQGVASDTDCQHIGCERAAYHRAPKSPDALGEHYWFCLEHVREYNRTWNFFQDMSAEEVEQFRVDAVTGHRPTWKFGERVSDKNRHFETNDPFSFSSHWNKQDSQNKTDATSSFLTAKQRKALSQLNLNTTATLQDVKMRYKQLVKRYHPDANGGDKTTEERFKTITGAYAFLIASGLS